MYLEVNEEKKKKRKSTFSQKKIHLLGCLLRPNSEQALDSTDYPQQPGKTLVSQK